MQIAFHTLYFLNFHHTNEAGQPIVTSLHVSAAEGRFIKASGSHFSMGSSGMRVSSLAWRYSAMHYKRHHDDAPSSSKGDDDEATKHISWLTSRSWRIQCYLQRRPPGLGCRTYCRAGPLSGPPCQTSPAIDGMAFPLDFVRWTTIILGCPWTLWHHTWEWAPIVKPAMVFVNDN